ncbi:MAG: hypothetical protein IJ519_01615 [Clostridia bacterium]|nr:hypothetical protein [Clostridia bacterium]
MKSLLSLLLIPIVVLTVVFVFKYSVCVREYKSESRSLKRRIRHASDDASKKHWEKRLRWQRYLLIPFVGKFMRNTALKLYANRKRKQK